MFVSDNLQQRDLTNHETMEQVNLQYYPIVHSVGDNLWNYFFSLDSFAIHVSLRDEIYPVAFKAICVQPVTWQNARYYESRNFICQFS